MDSRSARKEAIRKFKEQKPERGTFAVRCTATGWVWVGSSRNLDATRNGLWFCLRNGSHTDRSLQSEWKTHGEETFQYEILDKLDEDLLPMEVVDTLKAKRQHWIERLAARPL